MIFSKSFLGWFGKTAKDFTYEEVYDLSLKLANYYKENSYPGQKVLIGYDSRFLAKDFAEFISCIMAMKGIKVFLSNRVVPSSVLSINSKHKKSMGSIVVTGDEFPANFLGIRSFDAQGELLDEGKISIYENKKKKNIDNLDLSIKKWIKKGFIEPFDPSICYENHIEEQISFDNITPSSNRILFNPLFGSGSLFFDRILMKRNLRGYTFNNELSGDFKNIEPKPFNYKEELYEEMIIKNAELGFVISPDCTTFEFISGPKTLSIKEIFYLLLEHLTDKSENKKVIITKETVFNTDIIKKLNLELITVEKDSFHENISKGDYILALDELERFYFEFHNIPDALMAGYYLFEIFNDKNSTPSDLYRKLDSIESY